MKQYVIKDDDFERDDGKSALNRRIPGVSFESAYGAFGDAFAAEWVDRRVIDRPDIS